MVYLCMYMYMKKKKIIYPLKPGGGLKASTDMSAKNVHFFYRFPNLMITSNNLIVNYKLN